MDSEKAKRPNFSPEEMQTVLKSGEASALLHLLQRDGGSGLSRAKQAMETGDYAKAVSILKPMLDSPASEKLLQELSRKLGRS